MDEERGYSQEEIERGDDQAWHIPLWGCLALILLIAGAVLILRFAIFGAQDRCLDRGGAWRSGQCIGARPAG